MSSKITFYLNGKEFSTELSRRTVSDLLGEVGITVEQADFVSQDRVKHQDPNELIEICDEDRFEVRPRELDSATGQIINFTVNGEELVTQNAKLTVGAILERAGRPAGVDTNQLDSYYLENIATERRYDSLDEEVTVKEGDKFVAVHRGATPVA